MKVVIAPDAYKGSLVAQEVATTMKQAILDISPTIEIFEKPMADGGEGMMDALLSSVSGEEVYVTCTGPLGQRIKTSYAIINKSTALIEGARIAGLPQVPTSKRNPDFTTSYGIGEVILDALDAGCTSFIIGIGGSATNDGGLGMLQALGMKAYDSMGNKVGPFGKDLLQVDNIDLTTIDQRLNDVHIRVASDVTNSLCGINGASYVYGPQKGATEKQVKEYDLALKKYSHLFNEGVKLREKAGAGAAGGLGFAFLIIDGKLTPGAELIAEAINLVAYLKEADFVFTGEGQTDEQTLFGKAPGYIADLARQYNIPTILISGSLSGNQQKLREHFSGCFSIINEPMPLEQAMAETEQLLYEQTKHVFHMLMNQSKI